MVVFTEVKNK